jgi:hypothetical protein
MTNEQVMTNKRVFRSSAAQVSGWLYMVFAAANLVDIALHGRDLDGLIAAVALLLGCGIAYVIGLRPRVVADETGVRVRNPLRDVVVPWPALHKVTGVDSIRITYTGPDGELHETSSWVLHTSPRSRAKTERKAAHSPDDELAQYVRNRTPADFAAEQLTELAETHRRTAKASAGADTAGVTRTDAAPVGTGTDGAGPSSGERSAGKVVWWAPAIAALAGPALVLAATVLVAALG